MTSKKKQDGTEAFQYREILVTIDVPAAVAERLGKAAAALAKVSDPAHIDAFWIPPELMHMTLLHLGRVREDLIELIQTRIRETVADVAKFTCRMGRLDVHGDGDAGELEDAADALWGTVLDPDGSLSGLRARLADALEDMGVQHHSVGDFAPHVPVALFAKFRNTREFGSVMLEQEGEDLGEVPGENCGVARNELEYRVGPRPESTS